MDKPIFRTIDLRQRGALIDTLSQAFVGDPAISYIFPDLAAQRSRLPRQFAIMVPLDFADGYVLQSPGTEVVTLWRQPGKAHVSQLSYLFYGFRLLHAFGGSLGRALAVGDAIDAHHPKDVDYHYLHYAGVRPEAQGKGWGGAAIREGLTRAKAEGKSVYLETATESNVGLYQNLGFSVTSEWDVPRGGPHFWSMWHQ
ncbi:MAG: GNAT family N-acetyltransferase [Sphingomonadaceae bacterium]